MDSDRHNPQTPMRIAVILSNPIHYLLGLFRKLNKQKDISETVYLCSDFGIQTGYDTTFKRTVTWYDQSVLDGIPHIILHQSTSPSHSPGGFWSVINPSIVMKLRRERYNAIILHGYTYATNYLALIAAKSVGTKVLLRGESNLLNKRPLYIRAMKRLLFWILFSSIDAFLTIGTKNEEYYRHYGVPEKKLFSAPYTVDNEFYQAEAERLSLERDAIRASLGIAKNARIILFASKLIERKRPMDALRAFAALDKDDAHLIFAGDGPERIILEELVHIKSIKNVHFIGFVPPFEMPKYYVIADIFIFPSSFETWGLVVNEAMNFSLPIITTTMVGSSHDLIKDGENGFVLQVGDIKSLSDRLRILVSDERLRLTFGRISLNRINSWSYQETIEGFLAALKSV